MGEAVRQQVWIAEGLIVQFGEVLERLAKAFDAQRAEAHVLRAEVERLYPAIWDHLDTAATLTRRAGRSTEAFARVRELPGLVTAHAFDAMIDRRNLGLAREAVRGIKDAWPDLDWTPPRVHEDIDVRGGWLGRVLRKLLW